MQERQASLEGKVSRAWPLTESSPTRPMVSPSASEMKPRSREPPSPPLPR
jgi:hypothetical protein